MRTDAASRPAADGSHRHSAGILAASASLRTDSAMHVLTCVPLALLGASGARQPAHLECRAQYVLVRAGAPGGQRPGGLAYIGAIHVRANALAQLLHGGLGQARIGATDAGLCAAEAFFDASDQRCAEVAPHIGMTRNHLLCAHCSCPPIAANGSATPAWRCGSAAQPSRQRDPPRTPVGTY